MDEESTLDLREIFDIIKKRKWIIILITISLTILSGVLSFFVLPPTYEASVSVLIGKMPDNQQQQIQYNDVMMYQKLLKTYSEIAKSRLVAETTIRQLNKNIGYSEFESGITVTPQADTQIMIIKAKSRDAKDAMETVNTLSEVFIREAMRLYPTGNVQIIDSATIPDSPIKPNKRLNIAIAFVLGLMISLGLVFLLEYMDNTIKTEDDVEKYLDIPVIGIIPKHKEE
ncbi:Capsular polysaccharide biosynthesis protein [Caloramator quimbayensis]|uniref:Capsular polysaccharide biosynthesis protein n=1 Tax=Caloramator quimbayensis TaxID=1147123 RepID=A0A1T4XGK1_9CLOT|nr:Wzz/FepE/Etk N-terminal domain-containing protein [Caloramator quimbayensis]SKA88660.1 Capsular polysaccharide biosynthesis protein [Caloramator quimbayensis]